MGIFLVRHAQSQSNVDPNVLKLKTNMSVSLSEKGIVQANQAGAFLATFFCHEPEHSRRIKVWNSPYQRTRETAKIIKSILEELRMDFEEEESIYLSERQFGLVDDVKDYMKHYSLEKKHYDLHKEHNHDFFARPPLGESAFDMCLRLDFFLKSILTLEENRKKNHVIISHAAAIRGLIMMDQGEKYETYNSPNPPNASIRLLVESASGKNKYVGEIFAPVEITE